MRGAWLSATLVAVSLMALGLQFALVGRTGFFVGDFDAFYCASQTASQHRDPYLAEPLRTCESNAGSKAFFKNFRGLATPAPLPGFVFAALLPLTLLPFKFAAYLWIAILLAACVAAIVAVSRFAGVPWQLPFGALSMSLAVLSVPFGEVVPISIACICLGAFFAWKAQWLYAAIAICGSFIEPHLALPAAIGLFAIAPRSRLPLAAIAGLLAIVSLVTLGPQVNVEYVTSVLPAHVLSEIHRDTQYSLTEALVSIGTPIRMAIELGTLCYVATTALGIFAGLRWAKRSQNLAFAVCMPPAFAVFGGTFIHATQVAAAIPAAILLAKHVESRTVRNVLVIGLLALSVPWGWVVSLALLLAPIFPVAYIARMYWSRLQSVLLAAVGCAAISLVIIGLPRGALQKFAPNALGIDPRLAEYSWAAFTQTFTRHDPVSWILRAPTWIGLLALLSMATLTALSAPARNAPSFEYPSVSP